MAREIQLLDTVALLRDLPESRLQRGQVGTVVEELEPFWASFQPTPKALRVTEIE